MRIKTKLIINPLLVLLVAFTIGNGLWYASSNTREMMRMNETADNLVQGVVELNQLTYEYLFHAEKRAVIQWNQRHGSLLKLLDKVKFKNLEGQFAFERLSKNLKSIKSLFSEIVSLSDREKETPGSEQELLLRRLRDRQVNNLLIISQAIVSDTLTLRQESNKAILTAQVKAALLGGGFSLIVIILLTTISFVLNRRIVRAIVTLGQAANRVGSGRLDHAIAITSDDELGQVASQFNKMIDKLRGSYADLEREIVERKKTAEALIESERYRHMLFEVLPIGLALCRMDGQLVEVNQAYAAIIGRTVAETLTLSYWDITPPGYTAQEEQQLELLRTTGRYGPYEKEHLHCSGRLVPVRLSGLLIEKNGEQFIWSSVENITDRKQTEAELRNYQERLEDLVAERTHNLEEQTKELEKSRKALQYLLEDVNEAKKEVETKNNELDRFNKIFVNRELRMVELKKKIRELELK